MPRYIASGSSVMYKPGPIVPLCTNSIAPLSLICNKHKFEIKDSNFDLNNQYNVDTAVLKWIRGVQCNWFSVELLIIDMYVYICMFSVGILILDMYYVYICTWKSKLSVSFWLLELLMCLHNNWNSIVLQISPNQD